MCTMPAKDPRSRTQKFFDILAYDCTRDGDCILWPTRDAYGYGYFYAQGKSHRAHVVSQILATGEEAEGRFACHRCDNPACVSPGHLFWGTQAENMADMKRKGRSRGLPKGGHNPGSAKLNAAQVLEIREAYSQGEKQRVLAERYGVTQSAISDIVLRKGWKHV